MARNEQFLRTFNRGLVSSLALARTDLERIPLSAETMNNWMPRVLGSMMLRPGTLYLGATASNNKPKYIPFIFADDDTALVEVTNSLVRVWVSDALVTRSAVTASITNGTFTGNITGWTTPPGSTPTYAAAAYQATNYLGLTGDGTSPAGAYQTVTTNEVGTEHGLTIVIARGPVTLKVGSTQGDDDYIAETVLDEGTHSLTLTPSGDFTIQFENTRAYQALVTSVAVESSGVMTIAAPWVTADLGSLRYDQSGDIIYVACRKTTDDIGYQPYKIERRSTTSWSVVKYIPEDGPFNSINTGPITITPSVTTGDVTLTASAALFQTTSVGSLYQLASNGQQVTAAIAAQNTFTDPIKVFGAANARIFTITVSGYSAGTVTLQRTFTGADGTYADVTPYTADTVITYDDGLDNTEAWYRIGVKTGDYSATVTTELDYAAGSISGRVLVTAYTSATVVTGIIVDNLGSTDATADWYEGSWSDRRGWPTAVRLIEGRLGFFGRSKSWLSVSDNYTSYDSDVEGDSGPITRTVGSGPVDHVNWVIELVSLVFGTDSREHTLRASSQNEILTPSSASIKKYSSQGSADVIGAELDDTALFVQKGGKRLMQTTYDSRLEYVTGDLSVLYPESGGTGITHIAIQRQPDTRIHCVRADGTVAVLVYDAAEEVSCWLTLSAGGTDAVIEDVVVLPGAAGTGEEAVYYSVARTVNSATVRFLERWSLESECIGGTTSKNIDSHVVGTVSNGSMSGLTHLEGESVVAWVNGVDAGTYTVASGAITGVTSDGSAVVGLSYTAQYKSTKLGHLMTKKMVTRIGVIAENMHYQALTYGSDFSNLDPLPMVQDGGTIADDTVHTQYDEETFSFDGAWDTDSRLCLEATSPRPVTLLAALVEFDG